MRREFLEAGDWERFILKGDAHCSAEGVRKTAEAIYNQLVRPELVRQDRPTPATEPRGTSPAAARTAL